MLSGEYVNRDGIIVADSREDAANKLGLTEISEYIYKVEGEELCAVVFTEEKEMDNNRLRGWIRNAIEIQAELAKIRGAKGQAV